MYAATINRGSRRAPLLRDFLPEYRQAMEANQLLSRSSKRYYRNGVRLLQNTVLQDITLDRLTKTIVSAAEFPGSGSNANNAIRTLRVALSYAAELQIIDRAPTLHLYEDRVREQTYSAQQERAFLGVADEDTADAFILLLDSGIRPEECCRYETDWINWDQNVLRIIGGKTKAATREVPMTERVRAMLTKRLKRLAVSKYANHRTGRFLFPSKKLGRHIVLATLRKGFNRAKKAANLPADLVLYSTRHTFGTDMADLGNPKLTMKVMGHTEIKTSARYQHPETDKIASFLDNRNAKRKSATHLGKDGHTFGHTHVPLN